VTPARSYVHPAADFEDTQCVLAGVVQLGVAVAAGDRQDLHVGVCDGHHDGLGIVHPGVHVQDQLLTHLILKEWKKDKLSSAI